MSAVIRLLCRFMGPTKFVRSSCHQALNSSSKSNQHPDIAPSMSFINKRIQFIVKRKNGRQPSNYPTQGCGVPLRITRLFPMKLKDITLEDLQQKSQDTEPLCTQELMTLFDCFEKNDFNSETCRQQALALQKCYSQPIVKKRSKP